LAYRLTQAAEDQLDAVLLDSARAHGLDAAGRCSLLILTAMSALGDNPRLPGSSDIPRLPGVRAYPTRVSRMRVEPGRRVGAPRHLIVYRVASDGVVEVLGVVHDRMVLSRAARRAVRNADET
jgi:toxin ParE1/3/4